MIDEPCAHPVHGRPCGRGAHSIDLGLPLCWQHERSIMEHVDARANARYRRKRNRRAAADLGRLVYYAQRPDGAIKIGSTRDIGGRMQTLRCASPIEVLAAHPGGYQDERNLHLRFADARLDGEWFSPVDGLINHIANLSERAA